MLEIIINQRENKKNILLLENGNVIEQYEEIDEFKRLEGNIYVRKSRKCIRRNGSCIY